MNRGNSRPEPIHLREEELIKKLPEQIGRVKLNYKHYPGRDLYSDGEVEDEILDIVKNASRVEYGSIIEEKKSWPVLYHLSPLRGNIVDWLPIGPEDKVLEIGSGCGAITDCLSRKAGSVTCVDLSAKRSHINAYRNQDRDNIEIYVGNFSEIEPELPEDYDFACMIGVFEYGQSYIHTETPYEDFLNIMRKHVKNNGRIVIAIENKFGLKYWAGCKEDHSGSYFDGLEGYPEGGSARTFTRAGLEKILKACKVEEYSFYYPYPDYKFPTAIYSDRRLPHAGELTDNLRNFDRDRMLLFNEKYVFDSILQDGLFDVFANSYLVMTGKEAESCYVKYSNDRAPRFAMYTEIVDTPDGRAVRKVAQNEEAKEHIRSIGRSCKLLRDRYEGSGLFINSCSLSEDGSYAEFPYEEGILLEELLDECLARGDMEGFHRLFDKYYRLISYGEEKPVADYDLIFGNILVNGERWTVIDYEWTVEKQIPAAEIAFRAVYCYVLEEEKRNKLNLELILKKLAINEQTAEEYRRQEKKFQKQVTGRRKSMGEIRASLGTYSVDAKALMANHLQRILDKRIQVYYDCGKGIREEDSFYMPDVYVEENKIEAEIPLDSQVRAVRIDPADHPCVTRLTTLTFNGTEIPLHKKYLETNGKTIKSGCYVFDTSDPNIYIKLAELPQAAENRLKIAMDLSVLSPETAKTMMGAVKKLF